MSHSAESKLRHGRALSRHKALPGTQALTNPEAQTEGTRLGKLEADSVFLSLNHTLRPKYTTVIVPSYSWQNLSSLYTVPFKLKK